MEYSTFYGCIYLDLLVVSGCQTETDYSLLKSEGYLLLPFTAAHQTTNTVYRNKKGCQTPVTRCYLAYFLSLKDTTDLTGQTSRHLTCPCTSIIPFNLPGKLTRRRCLFESGVTMPPANLDCASGRNRVSDTEVDEPPMRQANRKRNRHRES